MSTGFRRFLTGIGLIPKATSTAASKGEMDVTTSDGKLNFHNGTSSSPMVTEAHSATLTNKTLTSPVINTPTGIVKGDVGLGNVDNTSDATKNSATATLTNKTIDGGSNTLTNLPGSAISGTVAIANGGTGQTTQQTALDALAGAVTSAQYLRGNGTHVSMSAIQASDVPTLNQNTTGTAANVTATSNSTLTTLSALSLPGSQVSGNISGNAANVTGTVAVANGGTGQTSTSAAFNALAPTVGKGDIIVRNSTTNTSVSVGSDGQVLVADASQSTGVKWAAIQAGAKNYISNNNFESNSTGGWNTFTTTMTGVVPTGTITNGAAGITIFTPTSTNPLAGTYSLQVQGSPTFPAGQGFYTQFTPDREDRAKVLQISFNYEFVSATGSSDFSGTSANTFHVYIYDVTNSVWIQPAGVYGMTQKSGAGKLSATFQTNSTATTYNLVVLCANTASGTTTMNFDDFSVGPQIVTQGAAVTDAVPFTSTKTNFTVSSETSVWSRVGDRMFCKSTFVLNGAPTGTIYFTSPAGYTIDTSKTVLGNNSGTYGIASGQHAANSVYSGIIQNGNGANGTFRIVGATAANEWSTTVPITWASGDTITVEYDMPIVGWSSNVQLSSDTDTRVVAASYGKTGTTSLTTATFADVAYNNLNYDTHNAFNTSTYTYTVPVSGYYRIDAAIYIQGTVSTMELFLTDQNNTQLRRLATVIGNYGNLAGHVTMKYNAGDQFKVRVLVGGSGLQTYQDGATSYLNIERVSGPAIVAANESVNARYTTTAGSSIPYNALTFLDFGTKTIDSHNSVLGAGSGVVTTSGTGWRYIAPVSGKYAIDTKVAIVTPSNSSQRFIYYVYVYVNGSVCGKYGYDLNSGAYIGIAELSSGVSDMAQLNTGDRVEVAIIQAATTTQGALNLATSVGINSISIMRVGN